MWCERWEWLLLVISSSCLQQGNNGALSTLPGIYPNVIFRQFRQTKRENHQWRVLDLKSAAIENVSVVGSLLLMLLPGMLSVGILSKFAVCAMHAFIWKMLNDMMQDG